MTDAPKKVVRIITRLNIGGPAQQAVGLSVGLTSLGWNSLLITGQAESSEGTMDHLLEGRNIRQISLGTLQRPLHPIRDLRAGWQILRILLREKPDLLHTHMAKAGALGRLSGIAYRLLTRRKLKILHTFHGHVLDGYFNPLANRFFRFLEQSLACATDQLIAVSDSVRADLIRLGIGPQEKIKVVPLGLPVEPLFEIPEPTQAVEIGIVGRLVPIKNHQLFLEAVQRFSGKQALAQAHCSVIGDGNLRSKLEEETQARGLTDKVHFSGWELDPAKIYPPLDIVCLTSNNEGTPVSIIEALAAGRPVVATRVGGVPDLLGEPVNGKTQQHRFTLCQRGLLTQPGDAQGLVDALAYLAEHPEVRSDLAQAGRSFIQTQYTLNRLVGDIDQLYRKLLS